MMTLSGTEWPENTLFMLFDAECFAEWNCVSQTEMQCQHTLWHNNRVI